MIKKIVYKGFVLLLGIALLTDISYNPVYGKTTSEKLQDAKNEKAESEQKLQNTQGAIGSMEYTKAMLMDELKGLNSSLAEVSENLSDLEQQQSDKQEDIEYTKERVESVSRELDEAKEAADYQYEIMKKRLRFVYEQGQSSYFDMLLGNANFSTFLNHAEYIEKMNDYDQKMLEKLKQLRDETEQKKEELLKHQEQLEEEEQKLELLRAETAEEQSKVKGLVDGTSANISGYTAAIKEAEVQAEAYEQEIENKKAEISQLEKELEKERELARRSRAMAKKDLSQINIAADDRELLACLIYCEAGAEPYEGKIAVGSVVMNRCMSGAFPDTIVGVIYQSGQFAPVASGRLAERLMLGANSDCYSAADAVMSGTNNIGDCLFFRTVIEGINGTIIGNHIFYNP